MNLQEAIQYIENDDAEFITRFIKGEVCLLCLCGNGQVDDVIGFPQIVPQQYMQQVLNRAKLFIPTTKSQRTRSEYLMNSLELEIKKQS